MANSAPAPPPADSHAVRRAEPAIPQHVLSTAKQRVGKDARATVEKVRKFSAQATRLMYAPQMLRKSAQQQVSTLTDVQVQQSLQQKPVESLRDVAGKGTRIGLLPKAGYTSVADVLQAPQEQLQAVRGLGPQSADDIASAAELVRQQVTTDTRFRFDPEHQDLRQTPLLATLAAINHAESVVARLRGPLRQFIDQTAPLMKDAKRAGGRIRMLMHSSEKKRSALTAQAQLDAILADSRVIALQQDVEREERAVDPDSYPPEQLWNSYASNAAAINSLLSTVEGADADDGEAKQGFISEDLRRTVEATPLNTDLLKATLRGYQAFGTKYALRRRQAILGDEMGLGKTIEALAAMTHLAANGQHRCLVVCPASVQMNWIGEISKHTQLEPHSLHGLHRDVAARSWLERGGVAVTTFGTLGSLHGIQEHEAAMLVVDEAHYVKNPEAKRSQSVREAIGHAQRTLFLTGTPMENRVEEFCNLVEYLQPEVARRIGPDEVALGAKAFRRAVSPVYLRRNQEDVLTELPEKIEVEDWVQFTPRDDAAYAVAVSSRNLMQMRQAAYHSGADSAKLERIRDLVEEAHQDEHKVVVYSFFLGVLQQIQETLPAPVIGPITGSVPAAERQNMVDDFSHRSGHAVLLSQIDAGGVGLNIQAASMVIIAEPQWKSTTEDQAIARSYRMGQVRRVQVHRTLAKGSVDERLREIQERKSLLFDEYARKSEAKDADHHAVDTSDHRPEILDDEAVPLTQRIVLAEEHRIGSAV